MINYNFKNKTVLITAGSKGIGFSLAREFAINGANVAICSRSISNLKKARLLIKQDHQNNKILTLRYDLNNATNTKVLFEKTEKYFNSKVDILINNSGGPQPKEVIKTTAKDWNGALNVNLKSSIFASILAVKGMKKKKWGRIINLTSSTAKEPAVNMCLSNVTRAGLTSFGKTLSLEVAKYGITVNTILTGGVLTDRLENLIKLSIKNTNKNYKSVIKKISNDVPVGRIATPKEFIQLILFLASENSSYITGTAIPIDGGTSKSIF
jgi:3-oxoacyl-[acyl-carrier protein] reductase|tara:strand:+ start:2298 stop:3098 length:801 start_codon:yes stop_codon:yes gene_type:complete